MTSKVTKALGNTNVSQLRETSIQRPHQVFADVNLPVSTTPQSTTETPILKVIPKFSACTIVIRTDSSVGGPAQEIKLPTSLFASNEFLAIVGSEFLAKHLGFRQFVTVLKDEYGFNIEKDYTLAWKDLEETKFIKTDLQFFIACGILHNQILNGIPEIPFILAEYHDNEFAKLLEDKDDCYDASPRPHKEFPSQQPPQESGTTATSGSVERLPPHTASLSTTSFGSATPTSLKWRDRPSSFTSDKYTAVESTTTQKWPKQQSKLQW
jgi:hypothetical protein